MNYIYTWNLNSIILINVHILFSNLIYIRYQFFIILHEVTIRVVLRNYHIQGKITQIIIRLTKLLNNLFTQIHSLHKK